MIQNENRNENGLKWEAMLGDPTLKKKLKISHAQAYWKWDTHIVNRNVNQ